MTNTQSLLQDAVERLQNGELDAYESKFIESIQHHDKKELGKLTTNQYKLLRKIAG